MFLNLPTEVIIECMSHLDAATMVKCRLVCRTLKDIVDCAPLLQLRIELEQSCIMNPQSSPHECMEKVERLRQLRTRWQSLNWTAEHTFNVHGPCNAYELVDGLFVKTDGQGNILILELPTATNARFNIIADSKLDFRPGDFALDATQDVIIFLTLEDSANPRHKRASLRIHSISTLKPHLEARTPIFKFDINRDAVWGTSIHRAVAQIAGELVGVIICTGNSSRLSIWNWKTGALIGDSNRHYLAPGAHSFSFVSPTLFYVTTLQEAGRIELYTVQPAQASSGFTHVATLNLPPMQDASFINSFNPHTEPYRAKVSSRTYKTPLENQLHVFLIVYISVSDFSHTHFRLYAPASLFLDYASLHHVRGSEFPVIAQWDDWGPFKTRFLVAHSSYNWQRYVHGQRVVGPAANNCLKVYDFNMKSAPHSEHEKLIPAPPTVLPCANIFSDIVVSRLPYFEFTKPAVTKDFHGYMIDEERIVGISDEDPDGQNISKLTVYTF